MPATLIDTSAWIAAVFPSHPFHVHAQSALAAATPAEPAGFCRVTEISFLRLSTHPLLLRQYGAEHMTNRAALAQLQRLLARPEITEIDEPLGITALWHQLASRDTPSSKVWMDAYLAAFAITGGLHFVTLDRDFKSYEPNGLQLELLGSGP